MPATFADLIGAKTNIASYTPDQLVHLGYTAKQLADAGYVAEEARIPKRRKHVAPQR